jgi:hypothetical protein
MSAYRMYLITFETMERAGGGGDAFALPQG